MPSVGIDPLSVAAGVAGLVSLAQQVSLTLNWYSRDHHSTPRTLRYLHNDMERYVNLLEFSMHILHNPSTSQRVTQFMVSIMQETKELLCRVESVIHTARRYKAPFNNLIVLHMWKANREETTKNLANVKLLMSLALQAHQAEAMQKVEHDTDEVKHLMLYNMEAIRAYNEHAARSQESEGRSVALATRS